MRPAVGDRLFTSEAIEDVIIKVKRQLKDPELAWFFENCFPNTLDTTVFYKEVDGYGSHILLEESTVPNLMSLPYVGYCSVDDPVYQNTRRWLLSDWNPKFVKGKRDEGIGSTHYPEPPKMIWPLSTIARALTTDDLQEVKKCVEQLKRSNAGTGFIHESYIPDNHASFTKPWFAFG